jgi:hypothetical protein
MVCYECGGQTLLRGGVSRVGSKMRAHCVCTACGLHQYDYQPIKKERSGIVVEIIHRISSTMDIESQIELYGDNRA